MYIRQYDWKFAVNFRVGARAGVISLARLRASRPSVEEAETLFRSRMQKILTKNIDILAFGVPQSDDDTSSVAFILNTSDEVDRMAENIVGAYGRFQPTWSSSDPMVTMTTSPGQPTKWSLRSLGNLTPSTASETFAADLRYGMFIQARTDFYFDEPRPLAFMRVYRTADPQSRPFGVGADDSLDVFLSGEMGSWIDLIREDGSRIHYRRSSLTREIYKTDCQCGEYAHSTLEFDGKLWHLRTQDGWEYLFPYRPELAGARVTILTGINGPKGEKFEMVRDASGDLSRVTTPLGNWLLFKNDAQHRITSIVDSRGRRVDYAYDAAGLLSHVGDSRGNQESYAYDPGGHMSRISDRSGALILENEYDKRGYLTEQDTPDGKAVRYEYTRNAAGEIAHETFTDSSGLISEFRWSSGGYRQSLPTPAH
jgi:YD repeat-containing protein